MGRSVIRQPRRPGLNDERRLSDEALQLEGRVFGSAPVQGEGTVGGSPFYFRARWNEWTFSVANRDESDPVLVESSSDGFFREGRVDGRYEASHMSLDRAEELIRDCARAYLGEGAE